MPVSCLNLGDNYNSLHRRAAVIISYLLFVSRGGVCAWVSRPVYRPKAVVFSRNALPRDLPNNNNKKRQHTALYDLCVVHRNTNNNKTACDDAQ